jgi:drug/metabolite transporter (DMT)-like permease
MKKGLFYILLTAIVFTTLEPVSKLISTQINPFSITFTRFFIGGAILLPFSIAKVKRNDIQLDKKDYLNMTLLGVLCICISMALLQYAVLKADSPALIAIIFSSNSVFTILFSAIILKDRITLTKSAAIFLCIAGVLICTDFSSQSNMNSVILAALSALTFSLYTVLSKKFMKKVSGIIQTGYSFFIGSIILLLFLLIMRVEVINSVNLGNIGHLLYLGIFVTGIGYWSYFKAMEKASAMAASLVFFIKPILTPFAAFFINGIAPSGRVFIALALVVSGSYLATAGKEKLHNVNNKNDVGGIQ